MSITVSFRLTVFIRPIGAASAPTAAPRILAAKEAFDAQFGEALKRVSQNDAVHSLDVSVAGAKRKVATRRGEASPFSEEWRVVYQNMQDAARLATALTGSPVLALIAELILSPLLRQQDQELSARVELDDILVDGVPAESWLATLAEADRARAREQLIEIAERIRPPPTPPSWLARPLAKPRAALLVFLAFIAVALVWSALDALVRQAVTRPPPAPCCCPALPPSGGSVLDAEPSNDEGTTTTRPPPRPPVSSNCTQVVRIFRGTGVAERMCIR